MLLGDLGDANLLQQMEPDDFDFVFGTEVPTCILISVLLVIAYVLFLVRKSSTPQKCHSA